MLLLYCYFVTYFKYIEYHEASFVRDQAITPQFRSLKLPPTYPLKNGYKVTL